MSLELLPRPLSRPRPGRPAPAGTRPPAPGDAPPDGWQAVSSTRLGRVIGVADRLLFVATSAVGGRLSRRVFLGRLGQLGLLVGLSASGLVFGTDAEAVIHNCNFDDAPDCDNPGACGPSEPCNASECTTTGNCKLTYSCNGKSVEGRQYGSTTCTTSQGGSWTECCVNSIWVCRDCCGCAVHSSGTCSTGNCSGATRYACICERNSHDPCTPPGPDPC